MTLYYSTVNFNKKNHMIFQCVEWFWHIIIVFVFLFSPSWRRPRVGETCWWLQCKKITFINPSPFVRILNKFFASIRFLNCSHNITQYLKDTKLFFTHISFQSYVFVVVFRGEKNSDSCRTLGGKTEWSEKYMCALSR